MMARSSPGRLAATVFCKSRNLVTVRTLVAICWRRVAMRDYSVRFSEGLARWPSQRRSLRLCAPLCSPWLESFFCWMRLAQFFQELQGFLFFVFQRYALGGVCRCL